MNLDFEFVTGTSTLALYGQGTLDDRLDDDPDWWTFDWEDLPEIHARRLCLFELGGDGSYEVRVVSQAHSDNQLDRAVARVQGLGFSAPTGRVYIGAGDCLPADELRPDESVKDYGQFFDVPTGDYLVDALRMPRIPSSGGGPSLGPGLIIRVVDATEVEWVVPRTFRLAES
jgi:hypothetical protein